MSQTYLVLLTIGLALTMIGIVGAIAHVILAPRVQARKADGYFPTIGNLTALDLAAGWKDLHCVDCGKIVGAGRPGDGSWQQCGDCAAKQRLGA